MTAGGLKDASPAIHRWTISNLPKPPPPPVLVPTLKLTGKTSVSTKAAKLTLRGTATNATKVQYRIGKKAFKTAKGTAAKWTVPVTKLKARKTVSVQMKATGPGGVSKVVTVKFKRKPVNN